MTRRVMTTFLILFLGIPLIAHATSVRPVKRSSTKSPLVSWSDTKGTTVILMRKTDGSFRLIIVTDVDYEIVYRTERNSSIDVSQKLEPDPSSTKRVKFYDFDHSFSRTTIWMAVVFKKDGKVNNDLTRTFYGSIQKTVSNDDFLTDQNGSSPFSMPKVPDLETKKKKAD